MAMELPDEAILFNYQGLLAPVGEEWTPAAELRARHFLPAARVKEFAPRLMQVRGQVAAEREMRNPPPEMTPLEPGFIDLPQQLLDGHRRKGDASDLGRVLNLANRLRDEADRIVVLGVGGASLAGRALFGALKSSHHNELPPETRLGVPRLYFDGDGFDTDALQELLDLLQITCVDPEQREERWAVVCLSQSGATMEPAVALRVFRREATEYYGLRSPWLQTLFAAATGQATGLRRQFEAEGHGDNDVLPAPDNVGGRFAAFTPAGLLAAAIMGLDVRALLLGAASMTKRFLEEPFERNPVLQFAGLNHLMSEEMHKPVRVLSVWSKKLEALGRWYEQLTAEALAKQGRGPTTLTEVQTRDLPALGQQDLHGPRDRVVNNLVVRGVKSAAIAVQMADHNEDELNAYARKTLADLTTAAVRGANQAHFEASRPTADLVVPALSEHTLGQLMQLLMLATVVEARLLGVNPYGRTAAVAYRKHMRDALKAQ